MSQEENEFNFFKKADVNDDGVLTEEEFDDAKEELEEDGQDAQEDLIELPSIKSLSKLMPPSSNENDLGHKQFWSIECSKFADENNMHFLGFSINDGEPMFKEKK